MKRVMTLEERRGRGGGSNSACRRLKSNSVAGAGGANDLWGVIAGTGFLANLRVGDDAAEGGDGRFQDGVWGLEGVFVGSNQ